MQLRLKSTAPRELFSEWSTENQPKPAKSGKHPVLSVGGGGHRRMGEAGQGGLQALLCNLRLEMTGTVLLLRSGR